MSDARSPRDALAALQRALGYKPLSRMWAKVEIVLGLSAAAVGFLLGNGLAAASDDRWLLAAASFCLLVLGGYLAMAGHRSHLYQSNNELAAYLAWRLRPPGNADETVEQE